MYIQHSTGVRILQPWEGILYNMIQGANSKTCNVLQMIHCAQSQLQMRAHASNIIVVLKPIETTVYQPPPPQEKKGFVEHTV
ncbi:hypothetical protein FKM82_014458 [Ascaphus truei]